LPEEQPITANPDVYEYDIPEDLDFILMGCDGIWERKSNEQMVDWVYSKLAGDKNSANLSEICSELLKVECLSPHHS